jgi:uridine phosphorylase
MKRYKTFDTDEKMYHLGIKRAHSNVISGGDPDRIQKLADNFLDDVKIVKNRGLLTAHGVYNGLKVTAFSTGMGPASTCITLPEIIEACDEDDMLLLRIGTSGGLKSKLGVGHYLITSEVVHDESTSSKIMGDGYLAKSSKEFRDEIYLTAQNNLLSGQEAHVGPTVVTDVIYFDADGDLSRYGEALGISMEFSVFCALRDWYNKNTTKKIKAGNLLRVSNMIVDSEYLMFDGTELANNEEIELAHIKVGLDSLVSMREKM